MKIIVKGKPWKVKILFNAGNQLDCLCFFWETFHFQFYSTSFFFLQQTKKKMNCFSSCLFIHTDSIVFFCCEFIQFSNSHTNYAQDTSASRLFTHSTHSFSAFRYCHKHLISLLFTLFLHCCHDLFALKKCASICVSWTLLVLTGGAFGKIFLSFDYFFLVENYGNLIECWRLWIRLWWLLMSKSDWRWKKIWSFYVN